MNSPEDLTNPRIEPSELPIALVEGDDIPIETCEPSLDLNPYRTL